MRFAFAQHATNKIMIYILSITCTLSAMCLIILRGTQQDRNLLKKNENYP